MTTVRTEALLIAVGDIGSRGWIQGWSSHLLAWGKSLHCRILDNGGSSVWLGVGNKVVGLLMALRRVKWMRDLSHERITTTGGVV